MLYLFDSFYGRELKYEKSIYNFVGLKRVLICDRNFDRGENCAFNFDHFIIVILKCN